MANSFNAAPGEMPYDYDEDDDGYEDARCEICGASPEERCTTDCDCEDCVRRMAEEDEHQYAPLRARR